MPLSTFDSSSAPSFNIPREEGSLNMTGTRLARFVNNYSPMYDKPFEHFAANSNVYLDDKLSEKLTDDRCQNVQHHRVTDKALKEYFLSRMQNGAMMRV
ncbi:hypothetical protein N2W54_001012 [Lotmaria passim]